MSILEVHLELKKIRVQHCLPICESCNPVMQRSVCAELSSTSHSITQYNTRRESLHPENWPGLIISDEVRGAADYKSLNSRSSSAGQRIRINRVIESSTGPLDSSFSTNFADENQENFATEFPLRLL